MRVAIVGKGGDIALEDLAVYDYWYTVGTHPLAKHATVCFECHGIDLPFTHVKKEDMTPLHEIFPDMPFKSTIDYIMATIALAHQKADYPDGLYIDILRCPMNTKVEYIEQRASLGYWIGYMKAFGIFVRWQYGPTIEQRYIEEDTT